MTIYRLLNMLLWPMHYSLYYMGFSVLQPFFAFGVQGNGFAYQGDDTFKRQLKAFKMSWSARLEQLETEDTIPFPGWSDWDETGVLKPGVEGYDYFIRARP